MHFINGKKNLKSDLQFQCPCKQVPHEESKVRDGGTCIVLTCEVFWQGLISPKSYMILTNLEENAIMVKHHITFLS